MNRIQNISRRMIRYFFQGILLVAPAGLTLYAVYVLFTYVDGFLQQQISKYLSFTIPGLGILLLVLFIVLLGFIGQSILFKPIKILVDRIMKQVPLVKVLYSALTDLFSAFVGTEKKFNKPVLVKVNLISDLEKIGFLTSEDLTDLGIKDKVSVYFPHSYNFSGEMFIVPKEQVRPLNIPAAEAMKFVVSGGVTKV
ncbi:MAG: DUF502 domain-containing protein [Bacteroidales bacterium]|nr:DUF502 domain-containing protein [Bacteroidales bacterium]MBN2818593.1 DUF502 domain-containing protein [Bacteroidales bacterium]